MNASAVLPLGRMKQREANSIPGTVWSSWAVWVGGDMRIHNMDATRGAHRHGDSVESLSEVFVSSSSPSPSSYDALMWSGMRVSRVPEGRWAGAARSMEDCWERAEAGDSRRASCVLWHNCCWHEDEDQGRKSEVFG